MEKQIQCDIAIIGSGMAGLGCVYWLQKNFGGRVICVSEGGGASALISGAIDPAYVSPPDTKTSEPATATEDKEASNAVTSTATPTWMKQLCGMADDLVEYRATPFWLVDSWGRLFQTHIAQKTQTPGDLRTLFPSNRPRRVGIAQFGDSVISPSPAKVYNQNMPWLGNIFEDVFINVPLSSSVYTLAAELVHHPRILSYVQNQLQEQCADIDLLLFPCIFGVDSALSLMQKLQEASSVPLAEMLGTSPSPPGVRWYQSMKNWLASTTATYIHGSVLEIHATSNHIHSIDVQEQATDESISICPQMVVLATGSLVGRGLSQSQDRRWQETLLHYPVFPREQPMDMYQHSFMPKMWHQGIKVDSQYIPVDQYGETPYTNLVAAGELVATTQKEYPSPSNTEQEASDLSHYHHYAITHPYSVGGSFVQGQCAAAHAVSLLKQSKRTVQRE